jgi:hypothetical protein
LRVQKKAGKKCDGKRTKKIMDGEPRRIWTDTMEEFKKAGKYCNIIEERQKNDDELITKDC